MIRHLTKLVYPLVILLTVYGFQRLMNRDGDLNSHSLVASTEPISSTTTTTNALVIRVIDGDTIVVRVDHENEVTVRLLGVNTPESVDPRRTVECFGKEASAFTRQTLDGQRIRLDEDQQADSRDKYGRWLRVVTTKQGEEFNAKLIKDGYAYAYTSFPMSKQRRVLYKKLEDVARESDRGLWSKTTCAGLKS